MKKTILASIAFAVATVPMTFAAQTPANPPAGSQTSKSSTDTTKTPKKHSSKKVTPKKSTGSTSAPAATGSGK